MKVKTTGIFLLLVAALAGVVRGASDAADADAPVQLVTNGAAVGFASLSNLVEALEADDSRAEAEIVLREDCTNFTGVLTVDRPLTLRSSDASACVFQPVMSKETELAPIEIVPGGALKIANLTLRGVAPLAVPASLIRVSGGSLVLSDGATVCDHVSLTPCREGAMALLSGELTIEAGARVDNCSAGNGCGGGVFVDSGVLNLAGGRFDACQAIGGGADVYVNGWKDAQVRLSGAPQVGCVHIAGSRQAAETLFAALTVSAPLTTGAHVGVRYQTFMVHNAPGGRFARLADGLSLSAGALETTCRAFENLETPGLAAEALASEPGVLAWGADPVEPDPDPEPEAPEEPVVVTVTMGGVTVGHASVKSAFDSIVEEATVVLLQDLPLTDRLAVAHRVTVMSRPGSSLALTRGSASDGWLVTGELTLTNVVLRSDAATKLDLPAGADAASASAIVVNGGRLVLRDGAAISGCRVPTGAAATGEPFCGTAIYAHNGATVELLGGAIADCASDEGAVFASQASRVTVGGSARVENNTNASGQVACDVLLDAKSTLALAQPLQGTARLGRTYATTKSSVPELVAEIPNWRDWDAAALMKSVPRFFHDTDADAVPVVVTNASSTARVVWDSALKNGVYVDENGATYALDESVTDPSFSPRPEPPLAGDILVVSEGVTNGFFTAEEAFASIRAEATVILRRSVAFDATLTVSERVVLTSAEDLTTPASLIRTTGLVDIVAGGSLTLANVRVLGQNPGYGDPVGKLFWVHQGGELTLSEGASVTRQRGDFEATASAIAVDGGRVVLGDGAEIRDCTNDYEGDGAGEVGTGVAIYAYNKATVCLLGGSIERCEAKEGAVFVGQRSRVQLGGSLKIDDNARSDLLVDGSSSLELVLPVTNRIGRAYSAQAMSDERLVADVPNWRDWDFAALTNSASHFFSDADPTAHAAIVTNASSTAKIVWASAVTDGVYASKDGSYALMVETDPPAEPEPAPDPVGPTAFAFSLISVTEDESEVTLGLFNGVKGCTYKIYGTESLESRRFDVETLEPVTNFVWEVDDKEIILTLPTGNNHFWKATAE